METNHIDLLLPNSDDYESSGDNKSSDFFLDPCYSASISSSPSAYSCTDSSSLPVSIHWFRYHALRLHDNPALMDALSKPNTRFRAVFVLDPWFTEQTGDSIKFGVNRLKFLLECLQDLSNQLDTLGLRLYVVRGQLTSALSTLCQEWNVCHLTYQKSEEPHSDTEENTIKEMAAMMGIQVNHFHGHTLYDPNELLCLSEETQRNGEKQMLTLKSFRSILSKVKPPVAPLPSPSVKNNYKEDDAPSMMFQKFQVPTMSSLGYDLNLLKDDDSWIGGETEALKRLDIYCKVRTQPFQNTYDCLFDKTSLSPYMRFGCLSARYLWHHFKQLAVQDNTKMTLCQEVTAKLLQREFYFVVSSQIPNFDNDRENPLCLQFPWEHDPELFHRWKTGMTGYPWIDAAIRQMITEGWIHHILRESIATFLTRGDLWITWVKGAEVFEMYMLDYEPSVSCGCWMKSSSSAFVTGQIEHYNPITFGQKIDPDGHYIRHHIPELKNYPSEYIYCPWMAPIEVQQRAGCIVGVHYPHPVVDHCTTGVICVERLKIFMQGLSTVT